MRRLPAFAAALLLAACGSSTAPDAGHGTPPPFQPGPDAPFATIADPSLSLPLCILPAGTIGVPDLVVDPLPIPDRGNGLAADAASEAPAALPAQLALRNDRGTYNRRYQFALDEGAIWFKSNTAVTGIEQPWARLAMPGCLAGTVIGIAVDDDELTAIRADGAIYGMDNAFKDYALFNWSSRWGPPLWTGTGHRIPADYLAWSWSVISPAEDQHWTDPAGNLHTIGSGKVSHIWLLRSGGQRYTYVDPWLPRDDSYEMCGPLRGRYRGVNLSASGSTVFTVNRYGDLYTRNYDFDLCGADPLFFDYAYEDQRGVSNPKIQLPTFEWQRQPKIPGTITHDISVHKSGIDMLTRSLRVEGRDARGHTGYWEKDYRELDARAWKFVRTDQPLRGTVLDNRPRDSSLDDAGPGEDRYYARNLAQLPSLAAHPQVAGDADWAGELPDFNFYCSPARLRIRFSPTEDLELLLHHTDTIRQTERGRGLDQQPRAFVGSIEIPEPTFARLDSLPPKSQQFIQLYLDGRRHTSVRLSGVEDRISVTSFGWEFERP
ncbi:hypothetical protein C3942_14285 [Solimonas fluminis]|uniref:Lipoprotein n=1 Tax=Solimonas fluminis TaxID=2086571 RepID=A0A2S5TEM1_9GAMM|nr:hypothetical protein [Solimonas fluminis]PPE73430.1 hypothetical protein C3942_14285 [Solimonas fluminis]